MSESKYPLLSICIPAYNGAEYLRIVLEALLPQARMAENAVEVIVADDCSTDDTQDVVARSAAEGCVRYIRNKFNLGMSPNIVQCLTKHARGEFTWVWSQHCVLHAGALDHVINRLLEHRDIDAFAVNFRCGKYPEDWPCSARGGLTDAQLPVARDDQSDKRLLRWEDQLNIRTSVGTQTYSHIIRTELSREFWSDKPIGREFTDALDTYSQTCSVAEIMFGRPAYLIGYPVFTIYNGAQTWSSLHLRKRVFLGAFPDLLRRYQRMGWSGEPLIAAQRQGAQWAEGVLVEMFRHPESGDTRRMLCYRWRFAGQKGVLGAIWRGFVRSESGPLSRTANRSRNFLHRGRVYLFKQCRPARWLRKHMP